MQRLAGWCAEARVVCMRKCHYAAVRSLRSHRPRKNILRCATLRCLALRCLALRCAAQEVALAGRLAAALACAHYGCLHRPCALQGVIDHGCESATYGRTGDTREHPGCACAPCRAHVPAFTVPTTQTAGAPAPPTPTVEAVDDTSTPPHTAGASTHSTCGQYVEHHCEYLKYPTAGAPPPPTVEAVNDTSTPRPGDTAAHTAGVLMCRVPASEYSTRPHVSNAM